MSVDLSYAPAVIFLVVEESKRITFRTSFAKWMFTICTSAIMHPAIAIICSAITRNSRMERWKAIANRHNSNERATIRWFKVGFYHSVLVVIDTLEFVNAFFVWFFCCFSFLWAFLFECLSG